MRGKGDSANYGIKAGGSVYNSPVQSGNTNSVISQNNITGAEAKTGQDFPQILEQIRLELTAQGHLVADLGHCIGLLDATAKQQLNDPEQRTFAKGFLKQLSDQCGGAPGVVSLIASALTLLATLQGP